MAVETGITHNTGDRDKGKVWHHTIGITENIYTRKKEYAWLNGGQTPNMNGVEKGREMPPKTWMAEKRGMVS